MKIKEFVDLENLEEETAMQAFKKAKIKTKLASTDASGRGAAFDSAVREFNIAREKYIDTPGKGLKVDSNENVAKKLFQKIYLALKKGRSEYSAATGVAMAAVEKKKSADARAKDKAEKAVEKISEKKRVIRMVAKSKNLPTKRERELTNESWQEKVKFILGRN